MAIFDTQTVVEALVAVNSTATATQLVMESLVAVNSTATTTQLVMELLVPGGINVVFSQLVVEILLEGIEGNSTPAGFSLTSRDRSLDMTRSPYINNKAILKLLALLRKRSEE